jgi:Transposase domain (DUF772)
LPWLEVDDSVWRMRIWRASWRIGGLDRKSFGSVRKPCVKRLDELGGWINWPVAERVLAPLHPAVKGEKARPPLAKFKTLLLATWYDLTDVVLAEPLFDRASFRRFCGFSRDGATPARAAFVRFRRQLVEHGLDRDRILNCRQRCQICALVSPNHGYTCRRCAARAKLV